MEGYADNQYYYFTEATLLQGSSTLILKGTYVATLLSGQATGLGKDQLGGNWYFPDQNPFKPPYTAYPHGGIYTVVKK
ncbi:hypothetical protein [Hymenobacter sp. GOD-10R]|uniref:hypothetical protein n=1 Tax=Hymenobacter sp. GOD-10R TaxID=3093922 RepID=UPI002D771CDD|nr:hypothetical protein [Hymenobacter sp. GOD-10R]WRQ31994.1 hypothetical protein SD425_29940 [Hymenobacter sp. GOD-10R]